MVLLDTSVWILVFRASRPLDIERLVDPDDVATCLPVIQEVLQGFRDEAAFRKAREAMYSFIVVENPLGAAVVDAAVGLYRTARRHGHTIRSSVDCLIAACALTHDLEVWHRDRDYAALATVSGLRQRVL